MSEELEDEAEIIDECEHGFPYSMPCIHCEKETSDALFRELEALKAENAELRDKLDGKPDSPDLDLPIDETFLVNTGAELYFDHGSKAMYRYQVSGSLFLIVSLNDAKVTVAVSLEDNDEGFVRLPHNTRRQLLKLVEALGIGEGEKLE